jgi:hypothetical protein
MKNRILKYLFLSFFCFSIFSSYAQQGPSYFSVRAGVSVPFGKFSSYNLQESSFAMTGITFSADGAWFFLPYLGVGGEFGYNQQPIDVSVLGYEKMKDEPALEDLTIRSEGFQTLTTAAGLYANWNFWKSFSLTGKLLGGWMWGKTPYQLYKPIYYLVDPGWYEITSAKDNGFIVVPGIGLQYDISPCIGVKAESELYYRNMQFGYSRFGEVYYIDRTVSFVNITLGLVILL